jgi:hypothetical protein
MWTPTRVQRIVFASTSLSGLAGVVAASFTGPLTIGSFGPPAPGAALQLQLLSIATLVSSLLIVCAFWRIPHASVAAPFLGGVVALGAGTYLAFGYWVPASNGAFTAPFALQGAIFLLWGLASCSLALVSSAVRQKWVPEPSSHPQPTH